MKEERTEKNGSQGVLYVILRVLTVITAAMIFFPIANPARVCDVISNKISLFTSAISYNSLLPSPYRIVKSGQMDEMVIVTAYIGALVALIGIILMAAGACCSLGNLRLQKLGLKFSVIGAIVDIAGCAVCYVAYLMVQQGPENFLDKIGPRFPVGVLVYGGIAAVVLIASIILMVIMPKAEKGMRFEMESKFKLFLMFLPFAFLAFLFCYLPLYGWRYAFFDYKSGGTLSMDNFVGLKWFTYLLSNKMVRSDVINVMKNTLGISGLNIITSWLPMVFAVFLCEMGSMKFRRFVQAFTTIPNFISWVLVYAVALSIFSTDGFINTFAIQAGLMTQDDAQSYLMGDHLTWIKMWGWGTWKGIGWSAIIYIAGISGIDQSLYEAATVDGAGRFQKIRHITLPGLLPTFFVLLLMAIAGILSNGLDQYLVFENADNHDHVNVLDLYVYNLLGEDQIPLSTVVGMFKSVISIVLLFMANGASKLLRGESII